MASSRPKHVQLRTQDELCSFLPHNTFKVLSLNARSLPKNILSVRHLVASSSPSVVLISETWLKSYHSSKMVEIPGYKLYRIDRRVRRGGGVAIYVANSYESKLIASLVSVSWESLAITIRLPSSSITLVSAYRCANSFIDNDLSEFGAYLDPVLSLADKFVVGGDFNINVGAGAALDRKLREFLLDRDMVITNDLPTRLGLSSQTTIDLIMVPSTFLPIVTGQCPGVSDHEILSASFRLVPFTPDRTFKFRNFAAIQPEALAQDAGDIDWDPLFLEADPELAACFFTTTITDLFNKHVPLKVTRSRSKMDLIYKSKEVSLCCRLRDMACSRWKKFRLLDDFEDFYRFRRQANYLVRRKSREVMNEIFADGMDWRMIGRLGIGAKSRPSPDVDPDLFNEYLVGSIPGSVCEPRVRVELFTAPKLPDRLLAAPAVESPVDNTQVGANDLFSFRCLSEDEVVDAIAGINSNACGSDGVPIRFIKLILPYIVTATTYLFNKLLTHSLFPFAWRTGLVRPIPKVQTPTTLADWRPISILPAMSKAFEALLAQQISDFVGTKNLLTSYQSGFRNKHSTATALINIVSDIRADLDSGLHTAHVLLDLTKAFDMVPHGLLVSKLHALFRFSSSACSLIDSYLRRYQMVSSNNKLSARRAVAAGVPQGAILAPLLFIMFMNDITDVIDGVSYHLYADDIQIYTPLSSDTVAGINRINGALRNIHEWCVVNGLRLNASKSQAIIYHKCASRPLDLQVLPPIVLNGDIVPFEAEFIKNLGIKFDAGLKWSHQIRMIRSRVQFSLKSLYAIGQNLPTRTRVHLVKALVLPHFYYGDTVLFPLQASAIESLNRALGSCIRFAFRLRRRDHISSFVKELLPLPLIDTFKLHALVTIWKIKHDLMPRYLSDRLTWSVLDRYRIVLDPCSSQFGARSVLVHGASLWNSLPKEVRQANSLGKFRSMVTLFLSNH